MPLAALTARRSLRQLRPARAVLFPQPFASAVSTPTVDQYVPSGIHAMEADGNVVARRLKRSAQKGENGFHPLTQRKMKRQP
jgi:hypothetical protein